MLTEFDSPNFAEGQQISIIIILVSLLSTQN